VLLEKYGPEFAAGAAATRSGRTVSSTNRKELGANNSLLDHK
jgi:hypothetical protein